MRIFEDQPLRLVFFETKKNRPKTEQKVCFMES